MNRQILVLIYLVIFLLVLIDAGWTATTLMIVPPKAVSMGAVKSGDYEAGYKEKIRANVLLVKDTINAWKLMVKTDDNNMGVIGDYTKPIGDFKWRATGATATQLTYTNLANYDVEAARGPSGTSTNIVYFDYRILLAWANDVPGVYNINVVYTLTTQ